MGIFKVLKDWMSFEHSTYLLAFCTGELDTRSHWQAGSQLESSHGQISTAAVYVDGIAISKLLRGFLYHARITCLSWELIC